MTDEQEGIQSHITDSKELTEARRIRALLERRQRVIDSLEAVSMAQVHSETEASETRLVFVSHLRSLILDLYPLLIQNEKIGSGESIGSFQVELPDSVPTNPNSHKLQAGSNVPKPKSFSIESLEWFTERAFPITVTWEVLYSGKQGNQTVRKEVVPPIRLCVQTLKRTMDYMAELKIDIEAHEEQGTFGFDYDELQSTEIRDGRNSDE